MATLPDGTTINQQAGPEGFEYDSTPPDTLYHIGGPDSFEYDQSPDSVSSQSPADSFEYDNAPPSAMGEFSANHDADGRIDPVEVEDDVTISGKATLKAGGPVGEVEVIVTHPSGGDTVYAPALDGSGNYAQTITPQEDGTFSFFVRAVGGFAPANEPESFES